MWRPSHEREHAAGHGEPLPLHGAAQGVAADGVIIWLIEEEDALIWELPAEMSALQASGTATLRLARRRWDLGDGALEEITAFTRALEAAT